MSRTRTRQPTFADLYAGAGLLSAGMVRAGFRPTLAVELDQSAAQSYARNIAECVRIGSAIDAFNVPVVDLLVAGPPCQGFSTLGRRDPSDVRNKLCLAVLPWARQSKAKVVLIENVPPFLRSPQWKQLKRGLEKLGYAVTTWELDAVEFGTPQRRRRAFTVASRIGEILKPEASDTQTITAGDVLLGHRRRYRRGDPMHIWPVAKGIAAQRIALIPPGGDKRDVARLAPELCPPSWKRVGCQATDVWGRIEADEPANTIRCTFQNPSKGRYLHPFENRVLSLREGARLQGIPDNWLMEGLPYPVARQIGNGVPIPLAHAVGEALAEVFH
jgi:DNA (cytosine-5)-methyltransferase 1